ncbi:hypothetical protein [Lactiplantibacillus plantarum]|uniref:hypothetical protein n=1 Tax=Lactiplantibacillus plantarum TaxID=1590 RepID=UPI004046803F
MARQHEWISLSQAGIKLGHDRSYVSLWLRRHPNSMPEEYLMETGTVKLISLEGIEWIRKQTKKEGVLVFFESWRFYITMVLEKVKLWRRLNE